MIEILTPTEYGGMPFQPPRNPQSHSNREVFLYHGLGCERHDNCFTCTLPDCRGGLPMIKKYGHGHLWVFTDGLNYFRTKEEMVAPV